MVGIAPRVHRYRSSRPDDAGLRARLHDLAAERRRLGDRPLHRLIVRKGMTMNHKKLYRLCREEGLLVRRRRGRKRARGSRTPMPEAARPNARGSLDFPADSFSASRRFSRR